VTIICPQGHVSAAESRFCTVCGTALVGGGGASSGSDPAQGVAEPPHASETAAEQHTEAPAPPSAAPSQESAPAWVAGHQAPADGIDVRAEPAPQFPVLTRLPSGNRLQVEEWRGAWARVTIPSGWGGWVDGRRLLDLNAPAAAPIPGPWQGQPAGYAAPQVAGAGTRSPVGPGPIMVLIGAGAALGSIFLPWLGWGAGGIKAFDIPFTYLWAQNPQQSGFSIGLVAAIAAGVILLVAGLLAFGGLPERRAATLISLGGGIFAAVVFAFLLQTIRQGLDFVPLGDIMTDFLGLGAWFALGGAVLVGVGARLR